MSKNEKLKLPIAASLATKANTGIELITIHRHDMIFGAGECVVTIGRAIIPAIAVYAAKGKNSERYITTADAARDWLVERGLNKQTAPVLIAAARGDADARAALHETNAQNI